MTHQAISTKLGRVAAGGAAIALVTLIAVACGSSNPQAGNGDGNGLQPGGDNCNHPNPGCPCTPDQAGVVGSCGKLQSRTGSIVLCYEGTTTCDGSKWADCTFKDGPVKTQTFMGGGLHTVSLGPTPSPCADDNPCDPYCYQFGGGSCVGPQVCVGMGGDNGKECDDAKDCKGMSACTISTGVCVGGMNDRSPCSLPADCPGGACTPGFGTCRKGPHDKEFCVVDSQCTGMGGGVCNLVNCGGLSTCADGGLCIEGGPATSGCESAMDWTAYYATYPGGVQPNGPLPTTCSVGPPDNCQNDLKCSAGACVPRAPAENGSCVGIDFTMSTPCYDAASGGRMALQICNRGTVAANSGILPIAHHNGSPSVAPSTCGIAANGPQGDCFVDLSSRPLAPGACIEFIPTVDCAASVMNDGGDQFYYVNQTNTGAALIAGECNTCNNFTATKDTAKPPGCASCACAPVSCGTGSPASGSGPPIFTGANGLDTCAGSQDQITNPCTMPGNPKQNCQQDFHCDTNMANPTYNKCVWNEPTNYVDPSCNGVDLTVGAGCDSGATFLVPVCNRGTQTLSTGAVIELDVQNSGGFNSWNANCAAGTGTTACSFTLTAPLGPGQCTTTSCLGNPNGQRWAIVNPRNTIAECGAPGAGCVNNSAQVKDNGAGCPTCACSSGTAELTGRILDPAKLRPVFGATLYVPTTAVSPFSPPFRQTGVDCDQCGSIYSGLPALASTTTDFDGNFRLQGVPAGVAFPVVLQLGRFRRQFLVGPIAACGTAALPASQAHLPATHTKVGDTATDTANPDLPLIAIVTGQGDATECLLARMGIATSEFTIPGGGGRVEMYAYKDVNGLSGAVGAYGGKGATLAAGAGDAAALLGTAATLNQYNALVMPCHNQANGSNPTAAMQTNLRAWLDAGGRLFSSHVPVEDFVHLPAGNANDAAATWSQADRWGSNNPDQSDRASSGYTLTDAINQTFPTGSAMAKWLQITWPPPGGPGGVVPPLGQLPLPDWRHDVSAVAGTSTSFFSGTSTYGGAGAGLQHNMITFDAPRASPPSSQCGRAVLPFMHVSSASSGTFPAECGAVPAAMVSGQELAFEFMMWEAMTCLAPLSVAPPAPPPPPPPPPPLPSVTFTREYEATCPPGYCPQWGYFAWQSIVPGGTSIDFSAQTAADAMGAPGAYGPSVPIGSATTTTTGWTWDACAVDGHLHDYAANPPIDATCTGVNPPQKSLAWLLITMTFHPTGSVTPILTDWRQQYDCTPCE